MVGPLTFGASCGSHSRRHDWTARLEEEPMRRRFALTLVVGLLGAACIPATTQSPAASVNETEAPSPTPAATAVTGGTITWGKLGEHTEFDVQTATGASSWQFFYLVYETLTEMGPNLEVNPGIAESWDNPSPTEYTFHLREGVAFSNGRALTADDVVGTLERLIDPATGSYWAGQTPIDSVTAVDHQTVAVKLTRPFTAFPAALAHATASILPMKELNAGSFDQAKDMLGSGPFMVQEHKQDESWTFVRNPHYWRAGYPLADELVIKIITDDTARIAALRDGSIDIGLFDNVDAPQLLADAQNVQVAIQDSTDYYRIDVNGVWDQSKLANPSVRFAINEAIDREQIRDVALGGLGTLTGATPPGFPESCDYASLPSSARDLDDARARLAAAGVPNLEFELLAAPGVSPSFVQIAQVIQQNLAEIGVTVKVSQVEVGEWAQRAFTDKPGRFDAAMSYFAGYSDPAMVTAWWNPVASVWNDGFLKPVPAIDELIVQGQELPAGSPERKEALAALCKAIDEDAGIIPLVTRPVIIAYRTDQLNATVQPVEGNADYLRFIAEFSKIAP